MTKNTDKQAIDNLADNFNGYAALLRKIKQRVLVAQQRAIYAANEEMLRMYWDIGGMLQQSQDADGWGKKTLQRLSVDLKNDYSEIKGFSVRNMQCMIQFFNEYNQELTMVKGADSSIAQSMIAQLGEYNFFFPIKHLGWTHNLILLQQVKDIRARYNNFRCLCRCPLSAKAAPARNRLFRRCNIALLWQRRYTPFQAFWLLRPPSCSAALTSAAGKGSYPLFWIRRHIRLFRPRSLQWLPRLKVFRRALR